MAIAFDAIGSSGAVANTVSKGTFSHTCTGSKLDLVVSVGARNGTAAKANLVVSGVTYNAVNLAKVISTEIDSDASFRSEIWHLVNPPTGAHNVIVSWTGTNVYAGAVSSSYTNVDQGSPIDGSAGHIGTGGVITGTTTTVAANAWIVDALYSRSTTVVVNGSQTLNADIVINNDDNVASSYKSNVTAGANTMDWTATVDPTEDYTISMASLKPSPAGANLVQSSGTAVLGVGSTSVVWANNTTIGNLVVVGVNITNAAALGTVTSITDSQSNTYTRAIRGTISSLGDVLNAEIWYAKNIIGGAGSVTVNHTIDNCAMFAREYSGFDTLDVTNAANGSSTTPNTGTSSTTARATELIVVATGDDKGATQTWKFAGAYGDMVGTATTITGLSMEDNIVSVTGAQTGTLTLGAAANWEGLLASFYKSIRPGWKTLLGAGQI